MGVVVRAKDLINDGGALRIGERFNRGHFLDGNNGIAFYIRIQQGDAAAGAHALRNLIAGDHVDDRGGPQQAVGRVHVGCHALGVGRAHKACKRGKVTRAEHDG